MIVTVPMDSLPDRWDLVSMLDDKLGEDAVSTLLNYGWIAGGCVRALIAGEEIQDVDVFFKNEKDLQKCAQDLEELGGKTIKSNDKLTDIRLGDDKPKIQLIKLYYSSPSELLESFDFTVAMFALTGEGLHMDAFSLYDLERKRIVLNKMTHPLSSFRRLMKYIGKGYWICTGAMTRFVEGLRASNIESDEFYPID